MLMDIEDLQPVRDRAFIETAMPFLKPCCRGRKPDFRHCLKSALYTDMGMKVPKSDHELAVNPFLYLGYGVNAYFDIIYYMMCMMITISIFCIPIFMAYTGNSANALANHAANPFARLRVATLGNLGGASVICQQNRLKTRQMTINCPKGSVIDYSSVKYGIIGNDINKQTFCLESAIWADPANKGQTNCTEMMDEGFINLSVDLCKSNTISSECRFNFT